MQPRVGQESTTRVFAPAGCVARGFLLQTPSYLKPITEGQGAAENPSFWNYRRRIHRSTTMAQTNEKSADSGVRKEAESSEQRARPLQPGIDYYLEDGLMVFTSAFLLK